VAHLPPIGDLKVVRDACEQPQYVQALTANSINEYGFTPSTASNGTPVRCNLQHALAVQCDWNFVSLPLSSPLLSVFCLIGLFYTNHSKLSQVPRRSPKEVPLVISS